MHNKSQRICSNIISLMLSPPEMEWSLLPKVCHVISNCREVLLSGRGARGGEGAGILESRCLLPQDCLDHIEQQLCIRVT